MSKQNDLKTAIGVSLLIPVIFILLVIGTLLHEAGHSIMAMILGIPFDELDFGWHGIGPGVTIPETTPLESLPYFRYAGGFFAATVLLVGYLLYIILQRKTLFLPQWWSRLRWWYAFPILFSAAFNLLIGYFEGSHFDEYVRGELPSGIHYSIVFLAPIITHIVVTALSTRR